MQQENTGQYNTITALRSLLNTDVDLLARAAIKADPSGKSHRLLTSLADAKAKILHNLPMTQSSAGAAPMSRSQYKTYQHMALSTDDTYTDLLNNVIQVESSQLEWLKDMTSTNGMTKAAENCLQKTVDSYLRINDQLKRGKSTKQNVDIQL